MYAHISTLTYTHTCTYMGNRFIATLEYQRIISISCYSKSVGLTCIGHALHACPLIQVQFTHTCTCTYSMCQKKTSHERSVQWLTLCIPFLNVCSLSFRDPFNVNLISAELRPLVHATVYKTTSIRSETERSRKPWFLTPIQWKGSFPSTGKAIVCRGSPNVFMSKVSQ